jgi:mono/diheme cytochrome c family protein
MYASQDGSWDWQPQGPVGCLVAVLSVMLIGCASTSATAEESSAPGSVAAGRQLALRVCTGCHIVSSDQPFAPVIDRMPPPPGFDAIANKPNTTAASLRRFLSSLPAVPAPGRMADPYLSRDERESIIAFIMSLRASH